MTDIVRTGQRVGDVEIREVIGEGGMGTVYAGFDHRLEREVALKVVRTDRLDARSRARLLREARMLSRLDHPNICRLFGYLEGEDSDFLMLERLRGTTLKDALAAGRPFERPTRLRLAIEIADTLRVAHARGIVHRDLSPANVMLVGGSEEPVAKVLDFGLARPVDGMTPGTEEPAELEPSAGSGDSVITEIGHITGTPGALSPEQARGESLTTASDMYSFGLLAQYLLTGYPPLEPGLRMPQKVARAVKAETLPVRGLDGESTRLLESLLSLEPEDRPTAAQTVEGLERVRDRPRRLAQRWLIAAVLIFALGGVAKYFSDLSAERNRALEARAEAEEAQDRAELARAEAEEVSEFLVKVFGASNPGKVDPDEITARQILDQGAERIEGELAEQPLVQARLRDAMGRVYLGLGLLPNARELQEKALESRRQLLDEQHPDLAVSLLRNAEVAIRQGRFDEAHALSVEAVELADGREDLPFAVRSGIVSSFGLLSMQRGDFVEAEQIFRDFLPQATAETGPDSLSVSHVLNNLAISLLEQGRIQDAEPLLERAVAIRVQQLGQEHVGVARAQGNLASIYLSTRGPAAAEPLYRKVSETLEKIQGERHPDVAKAFENLATTLLAQGRFTESKELLERCRKILIEVFGPDHPEVAQALHNEGEWWLAAGDPEEALQRFERAAGIRGRVLGPEHPLSIGTELRVAEALAESGDSARATALLEKLLDIQMTLEVSSMKSLSSTRRDLARLHATGGQDAEALRLLGAAIEADRSRLESRKTRPAALELSRSLWRRSVVRETSGDSDGASADRLEMLRILEPLARDDDVETLVPSAQALLGLDRADEAEAKLAALERLDFPIERLAPELASRTLASSQP